MPPSAAGDSATAELFRTERSRLLSVAYRMLGSVSGAEDVVQDAFARYQRLDTDAIATPKAYLTTMVTRIAIDHLRAARTQREQYVGSWLPEPLVDETATPDEQVEVADTISMAFLVLLETLSPVERAVFLLREAFEYDYDEIARVVERRPEHCRQIALRARRHVDAQRPRFESSPEAKERLASRFFAACEDGDTESLMEVLSEDCVLYGDGGGRAPALAKPMHGGARVARTLGAFLRVGGDIGARLERVVVNGQPGARFLAPDGKLINIIAVDIADGHVRAVRSVVNPNKLSHLGPVADVRALIAGRRARASD